MGFYLGLFVGVGGALLPGLARSPSPWWTDGRALAVCLGHRNSRRHPLPRTSGCRCIGRTACLNRIGRGVVCRMGNIPRVDRRNRCVGFPPRMAWPLWPRGVAAGVQSPDAVRGRPLPRSERPCQRSLPAMANAACLVPPRGRRRLLDRCLATVGGHRPEGAVGGPSDRAPFLERRPRRGRDAVACGNRAGGHPGGGIRERDRDRLRTRPDRQDAPCHAPAGTGGPEPPLADACAGDTLEGQRDMARPVGRRGDRPVAWPFWRPSGCGASPRRRGRSRIPRTLPHRPASTSTRRGSWHR